MVLFFGWYELWGDVEVNRGGQTTVAMLLVEKTLVNDLLCFVGCVLWTKVKVIA